MPSYLPDLQNPEVEPVSYKVTYGGPVGNNVIIQCEPSNAQFCVLEINFNPAANPHFELTSLSTDFEYDDEGFSEEIAEGIYESANLQYNPPIVSVSEGRLIVTNFDQNSFNAFTFTMEGAFFNQEWIISSNMITWNGNAITGQLNYSPNPPGGSLYGSIKDSEALIKDSAYLISQDTGFTIEEGPPTLKKKDLNPQKPGIAVKHSEPRIRFNNELINKLKYINTKFKGRVKRFQPPKSTKILVPPKPKVIYNPDETQAVGYGGNINPGADTDPDYGGTE